MKAIKRAIDGKQCRVNGRVETFSTHPLRKGDKVEIVLAPKTEPFSCPILFEDADLVLFNKPPGRTSESFKGFYLVHRLDKETSGVILLAKNEPMQKMLIALFAKRNVEKEYLAICDGVIKKQSWKMENELGKKTSFQGGGIWGKVSKGEGKKAITHFQTLNVSAKEKASLVLAKPVTGRTHQIRIHLSQSGHPVLGDWLYGKTFQCPLAPSRHMLHAWHLNFIHPVTGKRLEVEAPPLKDFLSIQKKLFGA